MSDTPTPSHDGIEDLGLADSASGNSSGSRGEVLAEGASSLPVDGATRRRRLWPFAVGGAAALAVGGAGVALGMMVGGGGAQPEDVMPSATVAYVDIDLDPGADQKLNMIRLLNRFPDLNEELGGRDDIRAWLFEEIFSSSELDPDDLAHWVGDRAGVGLVWEGPGTGPTFVLAVQVTDEDAARATLLGEVEGDELAFDQGYAVVATSLADEDITFGMDEGQSAAEVVSSAQASSLAEDADFRAAMDPMGGGLASAYMDGAAVTDMMDDQLGGMLGVYQGQMMGTQYDGVTALVVKAEPNAFAVDGYSTESALSDATKRTTLIEGLPGSTMFALAFTGGGDAASTYWQTFQDQIDALSGIGYAAQARTEEAVATNLRADSGSYFERQLARFEAKYNLHIPEDIITALGEDMVFAVDGDDIAISPGIGYRSITDPEAAADLAQRLGPLLDEWTAGFGVTVEGVDDGLVMASTPEYADKLVEAPGGLLEDSRARDALVNVENASGVVWVDFDKVAALAGLAGEEFSDGLAPMSALGVTSIPEGDGWSFHARLIFDE